MLSADNNTLQANTPNQAIQLSIAGTDNVAGEDLYFQINDGFSGPTISSVDVISDTIFATNNTGENGGHAPTGVVLTSPFANLWPFCLPPPTPAPLSTMDFWRE